AERMVELRAGSARASASVRGPPLLKRRDARTFAIVPVTGDRGLAGAFNAQILRRAVAVHRGLQADGVQTRWLPVGRKGISTLRFSRFELEAQWGGFSDNPAYADAQEIAHKLAELYTEEEVDRVVLVYNHFVSALVQQVTVQDVLPISEEMLATSDEEREQDRLRCDFIVEPEPEEILERLLPVNVDTE